MSVTDQSAGFFIVGDKAEIHTLSTFQGNSAYVQAVHTKPDIDVQDISDELPEYIGCSFKFAHGCTLRGLFSLLARHRDFFRKVIRSPYFDEFIDYGCYAQSAPLKDYQGSTPLPGSIEMQPHITHWRSSPAVKIARHECGISRRAFSGQNKLINKQTPKAREEHTQMGVYVKIQSVPMTQADVDVYRKATSKEAKTGEIWPLGMYSCDIPLYMDIPLILKNTLELSSIGRGGDRTSIWGNLCGYPFLDLLQSIFSHLAEWGNVEESGNFVYGEDEWNYTLKPALAYSLPPRGEE